MFDLRYLKRLCIPSHDALKDMARHDVPPSLVERIILDGEEHRNGMMCAGEVGRSVTKGGFEILVKLVPSHSYSLDEDVWVIKHVGKRRLNK
jgi:hypothetical protein